MNGINPSSKNINYIDISSLLSIAIKVIIEGIVKLSK